MSPTLSPIVFLHIPKTAGQTIHNELARLVGAAAVSPIRVHTQAPDGPQMPAGYRLYSGHLDWTELETLPKDRFVFTVLREPRERIASFYFYLLKEAQALSAQQLALKENTGKRMILEHSADDYFFSGAPGWQTFIRDHYENFYCGYFATRKMRAHGGFRKLAPAEQINRALAGLKQIDRVYRTTALEVLEQDIAQRFGGAIHVAGNYHNVGIHATDQKRWPKLMARLESDATRPRLEGFASQDEALMEVIDFAEP